MSSASSTAQSNRPAHILIVGTGAVGAFYGSRLHCAPNAQVSVTCRSNYSAVRDNGLRMETHTFGSYHFKPHAVFPSIGEAAERGANGHGSPFDYVVVATKALPGIVDDADLIAPLVQNSPQTSIVLIQNGVGVEDTHRTKFKHNPILSAVTVVSAAQTSPGVVKQNRWTRISVGPFLGEHKDADLEKRATKATQRFVELLQQGGIKDAEAHDEIGLQLVRWHKLAINSSMNPSSVLSGGTPNARMSLDPELRRHLSGCMNEIFDTAPRVLGRPWPAKLLKADAETILRSTERNAGGLPSMLLDWQAGRDMELEVILGNPIRTARSKGFEMPRLQTLYALLKMAATRRKEDQAERSKL